MKAKQLFSSLTLGLGLTLALLWLLDGATLPAAHAAPSQRPDRRPLLQAGSVITVCLSGGCDYTSIQDAVYAGDPGDEILVAAGTYTGVNVCPRNDFITIGVVTQVVYISKTVTTRGGYTTTNWTTPYPITQPTTLDAQGQGRVLYITGDISPTIEGLRITGGNATGLGGALGYDAGGGVYVISATATISNNQVFSNTAEYGGGLFLGYGDATLSGNTAFSNTATLYGGGLCLGYSNATLSGNTVFSNTAVSGGGLGLGYSDATLSGNTVFSNTATLYGGGLFLGDSPATLSGNTVTSNTADTGGGLYLTGSDATLISNTFTGNATGEDGYGGGLCLVGSDATLNNNTFISNTAHGGGGLVLAFSAATLHGNTVSHNAADGGGGLDLVASNSTLSNNIVISNTAHFWSGGLYVDQGSKATLVNNVVADNRADSHGSGLYIRGSSPRLLHTTIARNTGGDGSGVYVTNFGADYSTVAFANTILVSHSVGITVTGGNTVTANSILWYSTPITVSQATTATVAVQNQHQGAPAFAADGYHLTASSAAIDQGVNAGVKTDIDGDARPDGCFFDIGADEFITGVVCKHIYLPLIMRQYP